jgi:bacterioferritin-associated ferredoxin
MNRVFAKNDPLLAKQAYAPLYYLFLKVMVGEYAHRDLFARLKNFLEAFAAELQNNLAKREEDRDPVLLEFGRLMQQGTNDLNSLTSRVNLMRRYFLYAYSDVEIQDSRREFTHDERLAIWVNAGKKCAKCAKELRELSEMHADHTKQWAHGGPTTLANARGLCESCNQEEKGTF